VELNSRLLESHMELIIETNRNVVNTDHEDCTLVNRLLNKIPNRNVSNNSQLLTQRCYLAFIWEYI
jgi:hypothetical protein